MKPVIVEINDNEHKSYNEICERSKINDVVNDIGGKSVIIARCNYDKVKNRGL